MGVEVDRRQRRGLRPSLGDAVPGRLGRALRGAVCALSPAGGALLAGGCAHLAPPAHAKAVLVTPPAPYDAAAEAAGEDPGSTARRGVVLVPTIAPGWVGSDAAFGRDPRAEGTWVDAYRLVAKACGDSYIIWAVDTRMSATERALGELAGALTRDDPRAFVLRFSCAAAVMTPRGANEAAGPAAAAPKES